ncbi:MAG: LolA-related protein [Gammaproteobacteria bacterium]|nr:LolA-related protein [Gammaproteobacteria bacterium]
MKYFLYLVLFLQVSLTTASTLSERLAAFSELNESSGYFVETWSADYLDVSLVSKGRLLYKRPGKLSKLITYPDRIEQHIDGEQLSITHNNKTHDIQLSQQPDMAVGIYALQAILDGDEKKLHELFKPSYSESNTGWELSLITRDQDIADSIKLIFIRGKDDRIQQISIEFYNGDHLLTELTYED